MAHHHVQQVNQLEMDNPIAKRKFLAGKPSKQMVDVHRSFFSGRDDMGVKSTKPNTQNLVTQAIVERSKCYGEISDTMPFLCV